MSPKPNKTCQNTSASSSDKTVVAGETSASQTLAVGEMAAALWADNSAPKATPPSAAKPLQKRSRYIPAQQARIARERASYQCQYVGPQGQRCTEKAGLEIDHIKAFAHGGGHELENLQVLCRCHNLRKADWDFGEGFMQQARGRFSGQTASRRVGQNGRRDEDWVGS